MSAPDANSCFWGFWAYVKNNPFKTFGSMTLQDFNNMRDLFIDANQDALSATPTYTDAGAPKKGGGAGTTTMADTAVVANSSHYPEKSVS